MSQKLLIYWDFHTPPVYRDWSGKEEMSSECVDARKATVTEIATRSIKGMQKTSSEGAPRGALKQVGSSSRRPPKLDGRRLEKRHLVW